MRRALMTGVAALSAIAAPVVLVATTAGGNPALRAEAPQRTTEIHTQDASQPVRFVDGTAAFGSGFTNTLANGELTGIRGLAADPAAAVPTSVLLPPAPTTTTTVAPPARKAVTPPPAPTTTVAPAPASTTGFAYGDPADPATWDRLAQCEAHGNWASNTGNGYYGGLQFSASSWHGVGGTGLPHQNSREVQIEMGQRLQARSGWGQWPACTRKLHYR